MTEKEWKLAETPTDSSLFDVETEGEGAYAVGSDGLVIGRRGDKWETLVEQGPQDDGNSLYGADLTDDGEHLWFTGSSGVVGEYDLESDELHDRHVNGYETSNHDIAVTGEAGDANVYVVDSSGRVHYNFENGAEGSWNHVKPGTGAELKAVDFYAERSGYVVDDDGAIYTTDDGETWTAALTNTSVTLYGASCHSVEEADDAETEASEETDEQSDEEADVETETAADGGAIPDVWVSGDEKVCHCYGYEWEVKECQGGSLNDIYYDGDGAIAVGGGGRVVHVDGETVEEPTPTGETLNGVCVGASTYTAVGASGVVIEKE